MEWHKTPILIMEKQEPELSMLDVIFGRTVTPEYAVEIIFEEDLIECKDYEVTYEDIKELEHV